MASPGQSPSPGESPPLTAAGCGEPPLAPLPQQATSLKAKDAGFMRKLSGVAPLLALDLCAPSPYTRPLLSLSLYSPYTPYSPILPLPMLSLSLYYTRPLLLLLQV